MADFKVKNGLTVATTATIGNLTFANPGVGSDTTVTFTKTNDTVGFKVSEYAADNTIYDFYMGDNALDGGDYFSWRMTQWSSPNHAWQPFYLGGGYSKYAAITHTFTGGISQVTAPSFSTSNLGGVGANANMVVFNDVTKLKTISTSALTVTALNMSGYNSTSGRPCWIQITGTGTTFDWGYNSATVTPVAVQTGLTVAITATTLTNGIQVTFSGTTGAALDQFAFVAWASPNNTLGNTTVSGNISATNHTGTTVNVTGQLITTVATGTAPLVVTSTTAVANLNVAGAALATLATTANNIAAGATGSIPYQTGANATTFLSAGTSTQVLVGGASAPSWTAISGLVTAPPTIVTVTAATYAATATTGAIVIRADTSANNINITLPTAVTNTAIYYIKKVASANTVTVSTTSAQTIDGGTTAVWTSLYESITLISNNTNWEII